MKEESGFLPLAVPEIDPNYVVRDLRRLREGRDADPAHGAGAQEGLATYGGATFPYSAWVTNTESPRRIVPRAKTKVTLHPNNTYSDARASSSSCRSRTSPRRPAGRSTQICNQAPTDLVQCYAGTGSAGYDGAATGQGLAFIHSFATSDGTPGGAASARRAADRHGVHRRRRNRGTSQARTTSTTTATARSASPRRSTSACTDDAAERRHDEEAEPGRHTVRR